MSCFTIPNARAWSACLLALASAPACAASAEPAGPGEGPAAEVASALVHTVSVELLDPSPNEVKAVGRPFYLAAQGSAYVGPYLGGGESHPLPCDQMLVVPQPNPFADGVQIVAETPLGLSPLPGFCYFRVTFTKLLNPSGLSGHATLRLVGYEFGEGVTPTDTQDVTLKLAALSPVQPPPTLLRLAPYDGVGDVTDYFGFDPITFKALATEALLPPDLPRSTAFFASWKVEFLGCGAPPTAAPLQTVNLPSTALIAPKSFGSVSRDIKFRTLGFDDNCLNGNDPSTVSTYRVILTVNGAGESIGSSKVWNVAIQQYIIG
jgi:hypothetical protein